MRKILIAFAVFLAGFLAAVGWLRPYVPFFSRYTDGSDEIAESRAIRFAIWQKPESIGEPTNSPDAETRPALSWAGDWLFYQVGEPGANADIWMAPIVEGVAQAGRPAASLNSSADDISPFCDDGRYVYFASNRPGGKGEFDLYRAPITASGVGAAEPVEGDVNTAANEVDPAIRPGTHELVFASDRSRLRKGYDLYRAVATRQGYQLTESLAVVNSPADEREPGFSPDGALLFFASNRGGGAGGFDIWRSLDDHGTFLPPEDATALNSSADDRGPCPAAEGFSLLFASNRGGQLDLYRATTRELFRRPLPGMGWSDFTYVALLLLAALLAYLARRFQTLDFLAKCILLSILLHVLFMLWTRRVDVTAEMQEHQEPPRTFKVRLQDPTTANGGGGGGGGGRQGKSFRDRQSEQLAHALEQAPAELALASESYVPGSAAGSIAIERVAPDAPAAQRASSRAERGAAVGSGAGAVQAKVDFQEERALARGEAPALGVAAVAVGSQHASTGGMRSAAAPAFSAPSPATGPLVAHAERELALDASPSGPRTPAAPTHGAGGGGGGGAESGAHGEVAVALGAPGESQPLLTAGERGLGLQPHGVNAHAPARGVERAVGKSGGGDSSVGSGDAGAAAAGFVSTAAAAARPMTRAEASGPSSAGDGGDGGVGGGSGRLPQAERSGNAVAVGVAAPQEARTPAGGEGPGEGQGQGGGRGQGSAGGLALAPRSLAGPAQGADVVRAAGAGRDSSGGVGSSGAGAGMPPATSAPFGRAASGASGIDDAAAGDALGSALSGTLARDRGSPTPSLDAKLPAIAEAPRTGAGAGESRIDDRLAPAELGPRTLAPRASVGGLERFRPEVAADPLPAPSTLAPIAKDVERPTAAPPTRDLGVYSRRFGEEKQIAIKTYGGSEETEHAVALGLQYLASIQAKDGHWGSYEDEDEKYGQVLVGKSGLCLLAFLGAGHTPQSGTQYSDVAARAVTFLLSVQDDRSGHFGFTSAYSHGVVTYALAECYAITRDQRLREPLERAVDHILAEQHQNRRDQKDHGGWGYFYPNGRIFDRWPRASITAWQVMALESAHLGGLDIPKEALSDARSFLLNCYDEDIGAFRYNHDPARLRSSYATLPGSTPAALFALSLLGGTDANQSAIDGGFEFIRARKPRGYVYRGDDAFVHNATGNIYFWYYATLATFVRGGDDWKDWNEALKSTLLPAQGQDGSWKPLCIYARYAGDDEKDRSYTTSMCVLMLEVYYRYFTPLLKATAK